MSLACVKFGAGACALDTIFQFCMHACIGRRPLYTREQDFVDTSQRHLLSVITVLSSAPPRCKWNLAHVHTMHVLSCSHPISSVWCPPFDRSGQTANASHSCACVTQSELTPANTPNGTRPASDSRRTDNVKHRHDDHCSCPRGGHVDRRCGSAVRLHCEQGPQRWIRGRRVRRWEVSDDSRARVWQVQLIAQ